MRICLLAALLALVASTTAEAADPEPPPPAPTCYPRCPPPDVAGTEGQLEVRDLQGTSDVVPRGTPATHGDAPGRQAWKTLEEQLIPTCRGNTLGGSEVLCPAALTTCPADDQIRYWIWQRETEHVRDEAGVVTSEPPGAWVQLPRSYCLGPDDPGVPTIGRVIAQVQVDFRTLPLPVSGIQAAPTPTSLVNVPTAFFAGGAQTATFTPTILGTTVTITAEPSSWEWTWGDGTKQTTSTPGVPKRPVVSHVYPTTGSYQVGLTTVWTGTFTLPGSTEVFTIRTPAPVPSPPVTVQVREARSRLVAQ